MVVIRESPHARNSPRKPQVEWPPKSPFQALLSSPSGRKKWQDIKEKTRERSVSPSSRLGHPLDTASMEDSEMEDEEALKLKLEILETKQKLKELTRKKRAQEEMGTISDQSLLLSPSKRQRLTTRPVSTTSVQVPLSPSKPNSVVMPVSPARVRLGIDNTRAEKVSLKRATSITTAGKAKSANTSARNAITDAPVSSFSQRLAQARLSTQQKQDKSDRLDSIRSKSFADIKQSLQPETSTPSKVIPKPQPTFQHRTATSASTASDPPSVQPANRRNNKDKAFYDPFSEIHMTSRNISHTELAQGLAGCEIYTIPRLLKEIKSPSYEPPDCESDYVVLGVLAQKSSPFEQKQTTKVYDKTGEDDTRMAKNKFMVLRLCDLKWEIDCYLFGTGLEQYWKLTEGTLLAILNPGIMPPKTNQHNGRFSLKIASSEDRILEIGNARDIGYCTAIKKNGQECSSWINKGKTSVCEFHVSKHIDGARKGRMEVNTMWRGKSPPRAEKRHNPNMRYHAEYGQIWEAGGGRSVAKLMDDDDTDKLNNMTKEEASRKRIAAQQRERDLAEKLGSMKGGVAGDYFRSKYGNKEDTVNADAAGEMTFVKPTAAELGLLSKDATQQRLSPAKDRRRHFGIGAVSSAGTEAMGWGGSRKSNLLPTRATSPERGQSKLGVVRARSILQSPQRDRSASPKKARFKLTSGIREPGRESGGNDLARSKENHTSNDNDDDDDLDIV